MRTILTTEEMKALLWLHAKRSVYAFKKRDPDISHVRELVKKRLVRANVVIRHPLFVHMYVTKFSITRKGKTYAQKLQQEKRNG